MNETKFEKWLYKYNHKSRPFWRSDLVSEFGIIYSMVRDFFTAIWAEIHNAFHWLLWCIVYFFMYVIAILLLPFPRIQDKVDRHLWPEAYDEEETQS